LIAVDHIFSKVLETPFTNQQFLSNR